MLNSSFRLHLRSELLLSAYAALPALLRQLKKSGIFFEPEKAQLPYIHLNTIFIPEMIPPHELRRRTQAEMALKNKTLQKIEELNPEAKITAANILEQTLQDLRLKHRIQDAKINQALLNRIPSGAIVNLVRPNWFPESLGTPILVSHMGFAIWKNNRLYFRHATSSGAKCVTDVLLTEYLQKYLLSPTLKGINLLKIQSPLETE